MFYVYELVDPRDDSVFYVGKGTGSRRFQHISEARRGVVGAKCDRIREILGDGLDPLARVIDEFDDEQSAYDAEARRVECYGLENLTNISPGGGVAINRPIDPVREARAILRKSHKIIRRCLEHYASGLSVTWTDRFGGTVDFVSLGKEIADNLRERAGAEFFDKTVWGR